MQQRRYTLSGEVDGVTAEDYPDTDGEQIHGEKKFIEPIKTNGQNQVWTPWYSFDLNVQANDTDPNVVKGLFGDFQYSLSEDNRKASIQSDTIETSYRKSTSAASDPNDYRGGTPQPPASGPYGIANKRSLDGSIQTDSVASWSNTFVDARPVDPLPPGYCWAFRGNFNAHMEGNWTTPTYEWSYTGDGDALAPSAYATSGYAPDRIIPKSDSRYQGSPAGGDDKAHLVVDFHATSSGGYSTGGNFVGVPLNDIKAGFPKQGTVKLKAVDADGTTADKTFDITWHLPIENWADDTANSPTHAPASFYPDPGKTGLGLTVGNPNDTFFFTVPPAQVDATTNNSLSVTSAALSVGASSVPIVGHLLGSTALAGPTGYAVASLLAFGAAVATLSQDPPPAAVPSTTPYIADYAQFKASVARQIIINANPSQYAGDVTRVVTDSATLAYISSQLQGDNADWNLDPFFNNSLGSSPTTVSIVGGNMRWNNYFLGDTYDLNGYAGQVPGHLVINGDTFYAFTWTISLTMDDFDE